MTYKKYIKRFVISFLSCLLVIFFSYNIFAKNSKKLDLTECIKISLENNITIARDKLTVEKYTVLLDKSKSDNSPKLYFNTAIDHYDKSVRLFPAKIPNDPGYYTDDILNSKIQLKYPLYTGNAIKYNIENARLDKDISEKELLNTQETVKLKISQLYFSILKINKLIETYNLWDKALEEQKKSVELLIRIGKKTDLDLLKLKVRQEEVSQKIIDLTAQRDNLYTSLKTTMNIQKDIKIKGINIEPDKKININFDDVYKHALKNNTEVLKLQIQNNKYINKTKIAKALKKFSVYLNGSFGYKEALSEEFKQNLSNPDDQYYNAGITVSIPIFTGGEITSKIKESELNTKISYKVIEDFFQKLKVNITNTINTINSLNKNIDKSKVLIDAAEQTYLREKEKFNLGKSDISDVLLEEVSYHNALASYYSYLYDREIALINLKYLQGEPIK